MNGIHEVTGSIPVWSTTSQPVCLAGLYCLSSRAEWTGPKTLAVNKRSTGRQGVGRMPLTPRRILLHIIFVLVALALSFWLGSYGPVVHSEADLTAGISNRPTTN